MKQETFEYVTENPSKNGACKNIKELRDNQIKYDDSETVDEYKR